VDFLTNTITADTLTVFLSELFWNTTITGEKKMKNLNTTDCVNGNIHGHGRHGMGAPLGCKPRHGRSWGHGRYDEPVPPIVRK